MAPVPSVTTLDQLRAFQRSDPANKKCADCTETGPTYICVPFQTFVCQSCSGIHREFGHRVKSISLSQWDDNEVLSIKSGGGNAGAAKRWAGSAGAHAQLQAPSCEDVTGAREFLKAKYVEKRWAAPAKAGDKADVSTDEGSQDGSQSGASDGPAAVTASPAAAPAAATAAQPATQEIVVQVPEGLVPGQQFVVMGTDTKFYVTVPPNAGPGTFVKLQVTSTLPAATGPANIDTGSGSPAVSPPAATPAAAVPPAVNLLDDAEQAVTPAAPPTDTVLQGAASEGWEADFSAASVLPAPACGSAGGDLMSVDFAAIPQAAPAQINLAARPQEAPVETAAVDLDLLSFEAAVPAQLHRDASLLGMDLFEAPSSISVAAPAPAPVAALAPATDALAQALREAPKDTGSSGRSDDIMRIFKQCEKPAVPTNSLSRPADNRFAAFDDFEPSVSTPPTIGGFLNVPALANTAAQPGVAPPPAPQDMQAAQVMSLFAQAPATAPAQPQAAHVMSLFAQAPAPVPAPQQGIGRFTPDHLLQCKPQELAQMQAMINEAMSAQSHAPAPAPFAQFSPAPAATTPWEHFAAAPARDCDLLDEATQQEAPIEKTREFDDLVMLFKEKGVST